MSYMFSDFWGVVKQDGDRGIVINALGSWDVATSVTTAEDIGRLTSEIVLKARSSDWSEQSFRNQSIYIAGDTVTYNEVFDLVQAASSGPVHRGELLTVPTLQERLNRSPDDILAKYRVAFGQGKGVVWAKGVTFNAVHDISVTTVKDWLVTNINTI